MGAAALAAGLSKMAWGAKTYDVGVTDTEIKLGTTSPYSGPASAYGVYGQAQTAYFAMVNDRGGINGRKVNLISLDNAFSPPKAVEQTRKLVESDEVFAIAGFLGTPPNAAVSKYLNAKGVPSLFLTSGAVRFNDPKNSRWIVPFYPSYVAQGAVFGRYLLKAKPGGKIAVQYVNDDLGRDFLRGLKLGLGDRAGPMIVKELSHEMTEPTIDNQVAELKATGADVFRPVECFEICRAGHPQGRQSRLAPNLHHQFKFGFGWWHLGARRSRKRQGVDYRPLGKRRHGSDIGERQRSQGIQEFRRKIHAASQPGRRDGGARIQQCRCDRTRPEAVRR
jgi:hypothetical protein